VVDFFGRLLKIKFTDKREPIKLIKPLYLTGNAVSESAFTDSVQLYSIGVGVTPTNDGLTILPGDAGYKGIVLRGASGQTANLQEWQNNATTVLVSIEADGTLNVASDFEHSGTNLGVFGTTPTSKQTVTGSKAANAALTSLMAALVAYGLVADSTS